MVSIILSYDYNAFYSKLKCDGSRVLAYDLFIINVSEMNALLSLFV